ncbi:MAG: hypothetical protein EZS28_005277 [Streblomastix strix]|uniref:Uncharacterized protein n=1 Tax=Streblomastix strix TaxID=222440 RepID=A0A5J4WXU8_9EUKA|nr:MAG: hypothetical protein EZS28_005277 [Streblomastix strix]
MYDNITGVGKFNKEDFANIDIKSLRYQIFSGIRGRVVGNVSVAQQVMLFAKVCFDTLVAHLEVESGEIQQALQESIVNACISYNYCVSQYKASITTFPGASSNNANINETNKPEKPMTSKNIPDAKSIHELFENGVMEKLMNQIDHNNSTTVPQQIKIINHEFKVLQINQMIPNSHHTLKHLISY